MAAEVSTDLSVLRVVRWFGFLRRVDVQIDGDVAGKLQNGEEKKFSLAAGSHTVNVRTPWGTSNTITVELADGKPAKLDFEDNSKSNTNYWGVVICSSIMPILVPIFVWLGLPSIAPYFAAAFCSWGGYGLLEKVGVVAPLNQFEFHLDLQHRH